MKPLRRAARFSLGVATLAVGAVWFAYLTWKGSR